MPHDNPSSQSQSADEQFLQRAEQLRLQRECFCKLDLRQSSADFCRHLTHHGRSMWLDARSRKRFLEGLKQCAGVFTVATYEQILDDNQAISGALPMQTAGRARELRRNLPEAAKRAGIFVPTRQQPQQSAVHSSAFEFGYFEKRTHDRVKHTLPILLLIDERVVPAETRDLSYDGMQVRSKIQPGLTQGDRVRVRISPVVAGADWGRDEAAEYQVVRVTSLLDDTILALHRIEKTPNKNVDYLRQLVASKSAADGRQRKLDSEDALLTSYSLLAERFYMRSSSIIPFFLFRPDDQRPTPYSLVFSNPHNIAGLRAFERSRGAYDFSILVEENFTQLLRKLAHRESQADVVLAVHRPQPDAGPVIRTNNDYRKTAAWHRYLARHMDEPGFRVFKVAARRIHRPISLRVLSDLDSLSIHSTDLAERLLCESEKLVIAGALIDVTEQIRGWNLTACQSEPAGDEGAGAPSPPPTSTSARTTEVWPISYIEENRREPRFLSQMAAECETANGRFSCKARDISVHGLSLVCATPPPLQAGDQLRVSFPHIKAGAHQPGLWRKAYRNIPFQVVAIDEGRPVTLRLRQIEGRRGRLFASSFQKYLEKRKHRLPLELSHLVRSAASRFYSSVFIESTATVPVFIFERPRSKPRYAIKAGIPMSPSYLAGFFEVAEAEFDFQAFGAERRLEKLLREVSSRGSAETVLLLQKEQIPGMARFRIGIVDARGPRSVDYFTNRPAGENMCCVKLVACKPQAPPSPEVEQAISRLHNFSKPKTDELRTEFANLVAIGDLVDVTGQLAALQPACAAEHDD